MQLTNILLANTPVILQIVILALTIILIIISKSSKVNPKIVEDIIRKINNINLNVNENYATSDGNTKNKIASDMVNNKLTLKEKNIVEKLYGSVGNAVDFVYNNRTIFHKIKNLIKK